MLVRLGNGQAELDFDSAWVRALESQLGLSVAKLDKPSQAGSALFAKPGSYNELQSLKIVFSFLLEVLVIVSQKLFLEQYVKEKSIY